MAKRRREQELTQAARRDAVQQAREKQQAREDVMEEVLAARYLLAEEMDATKVRHKSSVFFVLFCFVLCWSRVEN